MPIYEYVCAHCGTLEAAFVISYKKKAKTIECEVCGEDAYPVMSTFVTSGTVFTKVAGLDDTDDLTLGKLVDNGGVPAEVKRSIRERVAKYKKGKAEYEHRQQQLKFKEDGTTIK